MTVGPDSVGYEIFKKGARVRRRQPLTATDIAVRLGMAGVGVRARSLTLTRGLPRRLWLLCARWSEEGHRYDEGVQR